MSSVAALRAGASSRASVLLVCIRVFAIAAILAGVFVRFSGLDSKLFSYDEATTSIRTAGYTLDDYYRSAFDGRAVKNSDFLAYQRVDGKKSVSDMVRSLAIEDPQHPPLYYLAERGWSAVFGNSVAARRAVSAIAGTLMLAAAFWLCIELFGSLDAGLIGSSLLAVSPFFVIYSQQAREYTVWGLFLTLASVLLVRAVRRGDPGSWAWYGLAVALALYSDLIFIYVLIGHALYVAIVAGFERNWRRALGFIAASAAAVASFSPWLLFVYRGRDLLTNNDYLGVPLPAKVFALKWAFNIGATFFDLDYEHIVLGAVLLPLFAIVLYAFYTMIRDTPVQTWALVVTLGLISAAAFVLPDLLRHESRSTVARYLLPTWLAIELAVAFLLASRLQPERPRVLRDSTAVVFAALLICGLASAFVDAKSETSWAEGRSIAGLGPISRILNAAPAATVIFIADPQHFDFASLALSNELGPDVRVRQLAFKPGTALTVTAPNTYVLDPTARVRAALTRSGIVLHAVYEDGDTAPAAIANLRAETAAIRRSHGEDVGGLSLWSVGT